MDHSMRSHIMSDYKTSEAPQMWRFAAFLLTYLNQLVLPQKKDFFSPCFHPKVHQTWKNMQAAVLETGSEQIWAKKV